MAEKIDRTKAYVREVARAVAVRTLPSRKETTVQETYMRTRPEVKAARQVVGQIFIERLEEVKRSGANELGAEATRAALPLIELSQAAGWKEALDYALFRANPVWANGSRKTARVAHTFSQSAYFL